MYDTMTEQEPVVERVHEESEQKKVFIGSASTLD